MTEKWVTSEKAELQIPENEMKYGKERKKEFFKAFYDMGICVCICKQNSSNPEQQGL